MASVTAMSVSLTVLCLGVLVTATSVEDANGNKYTETKNRYDSYYLTEFDVCKA